jgi:hypothetical protein
MPPPLVPMFLQLREKVAALDVQSGGVGRMDALVVEYFHVQNASAPAPFTCFKSFARRNAGHFSPMYYLSGTSKTAVEHLPQFAADLHMASGCGEEEPLSFVLRLLSERQKENVKSDLDAGKASLVLSRIDGTMAAPPCTYDRAHQHGEEHLGRRCQEADRSGCPPDIAEV